MNQKLKVKCDKCEHEFFLDAVGINDTNVIIDGQEYELQYFVCPECDKVYRILIKDSKYYKLVEELESVKKRIRRNWGKMGQRLQQTLNEVAMKKQERLKAYSVKLNQKFPGVFEFTTPENGEQHIIYRENRGQSKGEK